MSQIINFNKGFATLIDGAKPLDTIAMSVHTFFAKPMLAKGIKFDPKQKKADFLYSKEGKTIISELFVIIDGKQLSLSNRVFMHLHSDNFTAQSAGNCWIVPLELSNSIDLSELGKETTFK